MAFEKTKYCPITGGIRVFAGPDTPDTRLSRIYDIWIDTTGGSGIIKAYSGSSWAAGTATVADGSITNTKINASAAIAFSKLAALTSAHILVGNGSNVATAVAVTGDIGITNAGVVSITADSIINADIKTTAAIDWSKMATSTDISVTGTVTDLTIASEAQGDILYRGASSWVRLAKPGSSGYFLEGGTTPQWSMPALASASSIQTGATLNDAGANDATITFTQQTSAGASVVIPDFNAAAAFTFAFLSKAQTFSADQTIQYGNLLLGDNDNGQTLQILVNENMTGNKTLTYQPNDANRIIHLHGDIDLGGTLTTLGAWTQTGAHTIGITTSNNTTITLPVTGTLATLAGAEVLENKTLEATCKICDTADNSKDVLWDVSGATADKTTTLTFAQTNDRALTFPDATDTLVGKATTDTFTNKSFDCDGSGNALTNVNMTELDPIGDGACGIPFVYKKAVSNIDAAGVNIVATNPKMQVIDAWFQATSADTGTIAVHVGQVGSIGANIVAAMTIPADDCQITRADEIDDAAATVAIDAGLVAVGDAGASVDGVIFVMCLRVD